MLLLGHLPGRARDHPERMVPVLITEHRHGIRANRQCALMTVHAKRFQAADVIIDPDPFVSILTAHGQRHRLLQLP